MKVYLDTVGCRLNQSEIETFARQFRAAGHTLVPAADEADLVVINTCAVTTEAASDSRQKIRRAARAGAQQIIATGCWVTLNPRGAAALPGVSRVVTNDQKDRLVPDLLQIPKQKFELEPIEREPIPGDRRRTRAFIKVQDGCNNRCTFCVTTIARGKGRSRTIAEILTDIRPALQGETQEVVLTGVHLGSWGHDFKERQSLHQLVKAILEETEAPRLRLSSLEPWDLDEAFFGLFTNTRLCPHLHLPLQSGCAATLRRMRRKTTPEAFSSLVAAARAVAPDMAITTDIITGFPGEDESEFNESLAFVNQIGFSGGHVFTYSERDGTAAARMPGKVPHPIRKERNARMRAALKESRGKYQERFLGRELPVLWESAIPFGDDQWALSGLTGNYLRVHSVSSENLWNHLTQTRMVEIEGGEMLGQLP